MGAPTATRSGTRGLFIFFAAISLVVALGAVANNMINNNGEDPGERLLFIVGFKPSPRTRAIHITITIDGMLVAGTPARTLWGDQDRGDGHGIWTRQWTTTFAHEIELTADQGEPGQLGCQIQHLPSGRVLADSTITMVIGKTTTVICRMRPGGHEDN